MSLDPNMIYLAKWYKYKCYNLESTGIYVPFFDSPHNFNDFEHLTLTS